MKQTIAKNIIIGILVGLICNVIGSYLYILIFSEYSLKTTIEVAQEQDVFGNIIALGALLNLGAFFLFLKKQRHYRARGVLLATMLAAIAILVSKFF